MPEKNRNLSENTGVRLRGQTLEEMRQREAGRRYIPHFATSVGSYPHEGNGVDEEEPGDIERVSLVYRNELGPLAWLSEEVKAYRPQSAPDFFIGVMVVNDLAPPGNQLRVAIYKPGQKLNVVSVTNATLERSLAPLLPYPTQIAEGLADYYQMELYPSLQSLPEEIDFGATAQSMLKQEREDDNHFPSFIPLNHPQEHQPPEKQAPDWRPFAAGIGLAALATGYAVARQLYHRGANTRPVP